jgi:O-acetyl-ADP-ribose deacetylase (regulator of RNase III)
VKSERGRDAASGRYSRAAVCQRSDDSGVDVNDVKCAIPEQHRELAELARGTREAEIRKAKTAKSMNDYPVD